jgi:hypothetical protein
MQALFLTFGALAFAVFAPLKVTLSVLVCAALIVQVVRLIATRLVGPVSIADAARSVAGSLTSLFLTVAFVLWASGGKVEVEGLASLALLGGLFAAFVFGFKYVLNATFAASATIATASTLVSALALLLLRPVLF